MTQVLGRASGGARRWLIAALSTAALVLVAVLPTVAQAQQQPLEVTVRAAEVLESGDTQVVVDVSGLPPGEVAPSNLTVTEAGDAVQDVAVELASDLEEPEPRQVMVAVDVSGSTAGPPLNNALAAVEAFTTTVTERGVQVGLVSFGQQANLLVEPTTNPSAVTDALGGLEAAGETALYDAIVLSAQTMQDDSGRKSIVVFSDGADTVSTADAGGATNAASFIGADVSSVALVTDEFDPAPLETLADATGGRVVQVDNANQLQGAFEQVAQNLSSQYVITYPSTGRTGQFDIEVVLADGNRQASDQLPVLNTIEQGDGATPRVSEVPAVGVLGNRNVMLGGLAALVVGLVLLLLVLFLPTSDRQVARTMQAAMRRSSDGKSGPDEITPATAALSRRAVQMIERVPKPEGYDERLQQQLDRAAWPMRSSEFTTLRIIAIVAGFLTGWGVLGNVLFGLVFAVLGWFAPKLVLDNRVRARQKAFMEQLPDTLQLLAGSLKAGYGVLQAIDTVVKETSDPTASEFQRVLSEARLGLPLEDSLTDMADRIGTEDFRWVAVAINIQRRVGGNLAALLETVANTLRERAATRRQISALSAEGRLSAVILVGLPIVLALYMFVVQPDYIGELLFSGIGQLMLAGTALLMVAGVFWMRNLIDIDV